MTEPKLKALEIDLVNRLRQMLFAFEASYANLTDKCGIWLRRGGFDNNGDFDSIESHGMMKPFYERLLEEWERSPDKENLTREDFLRIQRAIQTLDTVSAASHTGQAFAALIGLLELALWI